MRSQLSFLKEWIIKKKKLYENANAVVPLQLSLFAVFGVYYFVNRIVLKCPNDAAIAKLVMLSCNLAMLYYLAV